MKSYKFYMVMAHDGQGWNATVDSETGQVGAFQATVDAGLYMDKIIEHHPNSTVAVFHCVVTVDSRPMVEISKNGGN